MKHSEQVQVTRAQLIKTLDTIANRGHNFSRVYSDWLTLSCCALTGGQQEELYLETLAPYLDERPTGERNADLFAQAFGQWMSLQATEHVDHLGMIFEERVSRGEKGQFFTPEPLCQLLAELSPSEGPVKVSDPACGSGRTLIAAHRQNPAAQLVGVDLDANCMRMTALNLITRNAEGAVVWGNTISLDTYGGYRLSSTPTGGTMRWMEQDEARGILVGPTKERKQTLEAANDDAPVESIEPEQQEEYAAQYSLGI